MTRENEITMDWGVLGNGCNSDSAEWEDFATKDWKTKAKEEVRIELGGCMMLVSGKKMYHPLEDQLADPFVQTLQYGMGKVNKS